MPFDACPDCNGMGFFWKAGVHTLCAKCNGGACIQHKVGDLVVCVDDVDHVFKKKLEQITAGEIYTIGAFYYLGKRGEQCRMTTVYLEGTGCNCSANSWDLGRFRKMDGTKTDAIVGG